MSGHTASDGVDTILDRAPTLLNEIRQLPDIVLGLGHRQAVSRHHDDAAGVRQHRGRVLGSHLTHRAVPVRPSTTRRNHLRAGAERAKQHVGQRPVHRLAHDFGEDETRRPHQGTRDDQCVVVDCKPGHGRGETGIRVQQRDHHRHVGAADRDDREHTKDERNGHERVEHGHLSRRHHQQHHQRHCPQEHERVERLLQRIRHRATCHQFLKLAKRNQAAGKRHCTDQHAQLNRYVGAQRDGLVGGRVAEEFRRRHQRRCATTEAVEQRNHLRHPRHLDGLGKNAADDGADDHRGDDPGEGQDLAENQRGHDGDQHADRRQPVTSPGGSRRTQTPET